VKDHSASDRQQGKNKQKTNKKQQQIPALPQKGDFKGKVHGDKIG
jgi:hypothetical protein